MPGRKDAWARNEGRRIITIRGPVLVRVDGLEQHRKRRQATIEQYAKRSRTL